MHFARLLMLLGMADVLFGLYLGIVKSSMKHELLFFGVGIALFGAGWWLSKRIAK